MRRRGLLQSLALAPTALAAPPNRELAEITVTGLEVFTVKVNARGNWMLTRVSTSAGITGIGDASHGSSDEGRMRYLKQFFELLKGRSIYDIEWLRSKAAGCRKLASIVHRRHRSAVGQSDDLRVTVGEKRIVGDKERTSLLLGKSSKSAIDFSFGTGAAGKGLLAEGSCGPLHIFQMTRGVRVPGIREYAYQGRRGYQLVQ